MTNRIRPELSIPRDKFGDPEALYEALNDRLRLLAELHEASNGLRGTIDIGKQKLKDQRGTTMPAINMDSGRVASLGDPIDGGDAVNLSFLRRQLECKNLARILEECSDHEDLIDDLVETAAGSGTFTDFWGVSLAPPTNVSTGSWNSTPIDKLFVWRFLLPFSSVVDRVTWENTGTTAAADKHASLGLYTAEKKLIVEGRISISNPPDPASVKTVTIAETELPAGLYYLGMTTETGVAFRLSGVAGATITGLMNDEEVFVGSAGSTSGGSLPTSFGTITDTDVQWPISRFWHST